jgi:hypothetical protein
MDAAARPVSVSLVRAMPGKCPIPLPESLGDLPSELELLSWCLTVREWGLSRVQNGRPTCITRAGLMNWVVTLMDDSEVLREMVDAILPENF